MLLCVRAQQRESERVLWTRVQTPMAASSEALFELYFPSLCAAGSAPVQDGDGGTRARVEVRSQRTQFVFFDPVKLALSLSLSPNLTQSLVLTFICMLPDSQSPPLTAPTLSPPACSHCVRVCPPKCAGAHLRAPCVGRRIA